MIPTGINDFNLEVNSPLIGFSDFHRPVITILFDRFILVVSAMVCCNMKEIMKGCVKVKRL